MHLSSDLWNHRNFLRTGVILWVCGLALGCATQELVPIRTPSLADPGMTAAPVDIPYRVNGVVYRPLANATGFTQVGTASWYGPNFHSKLTSNKEVYNMYALTAAHKTLPFHSLVKVVNLENGREVVVRINDRGPFVGSRIIDLSYQAGKRLGILEQGTARVRLTVLRSGGTGKPGVENAVEDSAYSVQIGVFQEETNARRLAQRYRRARVQPIRKGSQTFYKVLVGTYPKFEDAVPALEAFRGAGRDKAFIVLSP